MSLWEQIYFTKRGPFSWKRVELPVPEPLGCKQAKKFKDFFKKPHQSSGEVSPVSSSTLRIRLRFIHGRSHCQLPRFNVHTHSFPVHAAV